MASLPAVRDTLNRAAVVAASTAMSSVAPGTPSNVAPPFDTVLPPPAAALASAAVSSAAQGTPSNVAPPFYTVPPPAATLASAIAAVSSAAPTPVATAPPVPFVADEHLPIRTPPLRVAISPSGMEDLYIAMELQRLGLRRVIVSGEGNSCLYRAVAAQLG